MMHNTLKMETELLRELPTKKAASPSLDPPMWTTKAVSIPKESAAPKPIAQAPVVPKLIMGPGDRALPIPQHLLGDEFDVKKICTLSFDESDEFRKYPVSLATAVQYAAYRVGEFTNGPSFEIYGDKLGAKCWNFNCQACFPKTVVLKNKDREAYRRRRGRGGYYSDSSDCDSDSEDAAVEPSTKCAATDKTRTKLKLGRGLHKGTFNGKPIAIIVYTIGEPIQSRCAPYVEALRYTLVADRGEEQHLKAFVEACLDFSLPLFTPPTETHDQTQFMIYRWCSERQFWGREKICEARHMDTVILDEGLKDKIITDLDYFFEEDTAAWYIEHGLPYKRSFLFYGPPGTGKTSMITALAGMYHKNVCFVTLSDRKMDDKSLTQCLEHLPSNPFVVLEDIDSVFTVDRRSKVNNTLSFSGLLNALDGIGYKFGAVFFMTTNFVDRLDKALLRAGRCDVKLQFAKASDWQLNQFFRKFYRKTTEAGALEAAAEVFVMNARSQFAANGATLSTMQQHFVNHMQSDAMTCAKGVLEYEVDEHDQDARKMKQRLKDDSERKQQLFTDNDSSDSSDAEEEHRRRAGSRRPARRRPYSPVTPPPADFRPRQSDKQANPEGNKPSDKQANPEGNKPEESQPEMLMQKPVEELKKAERPALASFSSTPSTTAILGLALGAAVYAGTLLRR